MRVYFLNIEVIQLLCWQDSVVMASLHFGPKTLNI